MSNDQRNTEDLSGRVIVERFFPPSHAPEPSLVGDHTPDICRSFDFFGAQSSRALKLAAWKSWVLIFVASTFVGLVKGAMSWGVISLRNLRLDQMSLLASSSGSILQSMGVMIAYVFACGLIASITVLFLAPASAGGGVPDIKAFLNGNSLIQFLFWRTLVGRIIGVIFVTSCGVMAGPEGPTAHIGMILSVLIPQLLVAVPERDKLDFATIGSGIGIASAFSAPLAGTLFALEEAASFWHPSLISKTLFGAIIASVVGEYTSAGYRCDSSRYCVSVWGEFSFTFRGVLDTFFKPWEIPLFVLIGILMGIVAVAFSVCVVKITKIRETIYAKRKFSKLFDTCGIFVITSVLFCLSVLAADCVPLSDLPIADPAPRLAWGTCGGSGFNPISTLLLESPDYAIRSLLVATTGIFSYSSLILSFVVASAALMFTLTLPISSGFFVPGVLVGSLLGRIFGQVIVGILGEGSPGVYALAGAAAFLGGVSRMTLWIGVVMIEASSQVELTIPVILAVVASKIVADYLQHEPLYEQLIELRGIRFLPPADADVVMQKLRNRTVRKHCGKPVFCLFENESVFDLRFILGRIKYNAFPVISDGRVVGVARRSDLESRLGTPVFSKTKHSLEEGSTIGEDKDVSLGYSGAITVTQDDSMEKAYFLFTTMGLSMLPVTDFSNRIAGVLTRTDFHSALHH